MDLSDELLERWLDAPALFFRLELADTIVYKTTTAFVDFNFTFSIYRLVHVPTFKTVPEL